MLSVSHPLVYLATPYSHPNPVVRQHRFEQACRAAARWQQKGQLVFSPIAHSHSLTEYEELPQGWDFWRDWCLATLGRCDRLWVLQLDGWEQSRGVQAEIQIALERGIPIKYKDPGVIGLYP